MAVQRGDPLPEKLANAPSILPGLEIYYQAFWDLSTTRQHGMGLGPIPWDKVEEYADRGLYNEEQRSALHFYIQRMDTLYLNKMNKKS